MKEKERRGRKINNRANLHLGDIFNDCHDDLDCAATLKLRGRKIQN